MTNPPETSGRRPLVRTTARRWTGAARQRLLAQSGGETVMLGLAVAVGVATGLLVGVPVDEASPAVDTQIRDITWPGRTIVTSIRRNAEVVVPSGQTVLQAGDEITFLAGPDAVETIRRLVGPTGDFAP